MMTAQERANWTAGWFMQIDEHRDADRAYEALRPIVLAEGGEINLKLFLGRWIIRVCGLSTKDESRLDGVALKAIKASRRSYHRAINLAKSLADDRANYGQIARIYRSIGEVGYAEWYEMRA